MMRTVGRTVAAGVALRGEEAADGDADGRFVAEHSPVRGPVER